MITLTRLSSDTGGSEYCPICKQATKSLKLDASASINFNYQLLGTANFAETLCAHITKTHNFQQSVWLHLTTGLKTRLSRYQEAYASVGRQLKTLKTELEATKREAEAEKARLQEENRQLREQNQKLRNDVVTLRTKLTDARHSAGSRRSHMQAPASREPPVAAPLTDRTVPERMTVAVLDSSRGVLAGEGPSATPLLPAFPVKRTPVSGGRLTMSNLKTSGGRLSRDSFGHGTASLRTFRFT